MENAVSSTAGLPYSWEIAEDSQKGLSFAVCKLDDGRNLLQSSAFKTKSGVEKFLTSCRELARAPKNFKEEKESGKFYFTLRDAGGKEVAKSELYDTEEALKADLKIFRKAPAANAKVPDYGGESGEEKFTLVFTRDNRGEYAGRITHRVSNQFADFQNLNTELITRFVQSFLPEVQSVRATPVRLLLYDDSDGKATNIIIRDRRSLKLVLQEFPEAWAADQLCRLQMQVSALGGRSVISLQIATQLSADRSLLCVLPIGELNAGAYRLQASCTAETEAQTLLLAAANCLFQII